MTEIEKEESNSLTLTISDYIEMVLEIPICKELKQYVEILYEEYEKDLEKFKFHYNYLSRGSCKTDLILILPMAFEYYRKIKE